MNQETLYHDKEKNLLKKRKNITDSMGNMVESVLFDSRGNQISKSLYSYGNNRNRKGLNGKFLIPRIYCLATTFTTMKMAGLPKQKASPPPA
jgi:hypothetical protein